MKKSVVWASEVAACMGLLSWLTPRDVYRRAVLGERRDIPQTAAMRIGAGMEGAVLRMGSKMFDARIIAADDDGLAAEVGAQVITALADEIRVCGRCDALAERAGERLVIEVKCVRDWAWDRVPPQYAIQAQAYMALYGTRRAELWVLHSGMDIKKYELEYDENLLAEMNLSVAGVLDAEDYPPLQNEYDARAALRDIASRLRGRESMITLRDATSAEAVRELVAKRRARRDLSAEMSALDGEIKMHEAAIAAAMGTNSSAEIFCPQTGDEYDVSLKLITRKSFQTKDTSYTQLSLKKRQG